MGRQDSTHKGGSGSATLDALLGHTHTKFFGCVRGSGSKWHAQPWLRGGAPREVLQAGEGETEADPQGAGEEGLSQRQEHRGHSIGRGKAQELSRSHRDIKTLQGLNWLNDEIINFL